MTAFNALLNEVDSKGCLDNWRPWERRKEVVKEKQSSQSWEGSLASKTGRVTKTIVRSNISPCLEKGHPPRVQVDGDDVEMFDPKAAVLRMLKEPQKETWSDNLDLDGDGEGSGQKEATKVKQETTMLQCKGI